MRNVLAKTQQRHASETIDEKKAKKTSVKGSTNVEKKGLKSDKVEQQYFGYYSSLCRRCSMFIGVVVRMSILDTKVDGSIPSINMFSP